MRDVDALLAALEVPAPAGPPPAPPRPPRRAGRAAAAGLATAGVALLAALGARPGPAARGVGDALPPTFDLQMAVERGGVAVRAGRVAHVGERVFFRASADRPARAPLWVEGPAGRAAIATVDAEPVARDVGGPGGLVAWRFDAPGTYVFHLGDCAACPAVALEVR